MKVSNEFQKILTKQGIKFKLNCEFYRKDLGSEVKLNIKVMKKEK